MLQLLDVYVMQARLVPVFIVLLPVALTAMAWLPKGVADYVWGVLGTLGAVVLLAELGRDLGKQKESALFERWGGGPATRILSHEHSWLDQHTLQRYHAKLNQLLPTLSLPTPAQEQKQPDDALVKYESCIQYLRQVTRERQRFPLVFAENVSYGFRRNLWAMRPAGVFVTILVLVLMPCCSRASCSQSKRCQSHRFLCFVLTCCCWCCGFFGSAWLGWSWPREHMRNDWWPHARTFSSRPIFA